MRRGDVVIISTPGDDGKPRPAVVIQSDALNESTIQSVAVCLMTSSLNGNPATRTTIHPSTTNGLAKTTNVMVEKLYTLHASKVTGVIGRLNPDELAELDHSLTFVLGL